MQRWNCRPGWTSYACDAYILAAALQQKRPLLALDRRLLHAAGETGVQVLEVTS